VSLQIRALRFIEEERSILLYENIFKEIKDNKDKNAGNLGLL